MAVNKHLAAAAILGCLAGASAMFAFEGQTIDNMYKDNQEYLSQIDDLRKERTLLEAKLDRVNPQREIESIQVSAKGPDGLSVLEVEQFVKNQLSFLIGTPLSALAEHPDLPARLINDRIYTSDQQKYTIKVDTVVLGEKLFIAVTATQSTSQ